MPTGAAVTDERPHATVYTIDVDEDGDATWTIELRYQLITDSEVDSFETLRTDFEEGNLTVFEDIEDEMAPFAEEASNQTGRSMSITDFERDVEIRDTVTLTVGVVSVNFEWTNFAAANNSTVHVGDVFAGGGLALSQDERLVIERLDSLPVRSVAPEPDIRDSNRFVWDGERFFEKEQPEVVFGEERQTGGNDENVSDDDTGGEESPGGAPSAATLLGGLFVLVSGLAGGFYLSRAGMARRDAETDDEIAVDSSDEKGSEGDLMSDEDRVVSILEDNGGKMKQAEIVEQTDWSKSKVSMLLSDMEEEGTISKLRLGRENVIELETE